jgi:biotin-dependent carboxylase-like uncharacterized protein
MIRVISAGMHSSIQDLGRFGFRNQGVPNSGSMDSISAKLANSILNNKLNSALLEITIIGPKLIFDTDTYIAITGANISPKLNNVAILNCKVIKVKKGDILSFGKLLYGTRGYIAVYGGIQSEVKLNSRCQYTNITRESRLSKNDEIEINRLPNEIKLNHKGKIKSKFKYFEKNEISVFPGPEFELLSKNKQYKLLNTEFTISNNSNRMGYRMEEVISKHSISMITSPVMPGTVQLLPSGQIVVLMKDAQTTGGYPRIFQLNELAICTMAQKKVGDTFKLKLSPTQI